MKEWCSHNQILVCSDDAKLDALNDAVVDESSSDDDEPRPVSLEFELKFKLVDQVLTVSDLPIPNTLNCRQRRHLLDSVNAAQWPFYPPCQEIQPCSVSIVIFVFGGSYLIIILLSFNKPE
jgi:hypothetical protein